MGRITRAKAAEVAERLHIDEDAVLDLSQIDEKPDPATPESTDRAVLGDIAPNSADSKGSELVGRKTRSKKKAKGRSGADANVEMKQDEKQDEEIDNEQAEKVVEDQTQEEEALEATKNETMERLAKLRITSLGNQAPVQTPDVSMSEENSNITPLPEMEETTTHKGNNAEALDADTSVATPAMSESENELPDISITTQPQVDESEQSEAMEQPIYEEPSSPIATAVPKVIKSLRKDSPAKRSTSNKENVEPVEPLIVEPTNVEPAEQREVSVEPIEVVEPERSAEPVEQIAPTETVQQEDVASATSPALADAQTSLSPQASTDNAIAAEPTTSPSRPQSSGKSEDQIEALDNFNEAVEKVNESIPDVPSPAKKSSPKPTDAKEKLKKAKPAPVVRMTKAAAARLSMAQGGDKDAGNTAAKARPRPSSMIGRSNTVRQSVAPAPARNTSITANKPSPRPKKETVIPHSKPRPVSLSFPTPPPAARSSKAPTKSSFQLPGEAVAAKLKAAREERMKREAAAATSKAAAKPTPEEKKPAFKARPVPSTLKKAPSVRQTAASKARESTITGDAAAKPPSSSSTTGLKRSNTVATSRPRPSTISTTTAKPSAPTQLTVQKRARPSSVHIPASSAAAPRVPSATASNPSTAPSSRNTSATSKGKEVYARFSAARNAAENEKREKEDAARKARAAAAERGRVASREWAEKQRVKKMVAMMEGGGAKE